MKILHIDIETAPNLVHAWGLYRQNLGINQIQQPGYTLCFAAKWHKQSAITFKSIHHDGAEAMTVAAWEMLNEADAVVHYNGTKFDIPKLNTEFTKHGLTPPSPYHQIDLLTTVRRQFRFASNKLDYVCQALGLGAKVCHKGHELWTGCMAGNAKDWAIMRRYNEHDVRLLPRLYTHILPWIQNHPNPALHDGATRPTCSRCGGPVKWKGFRHTKTMTYRRYQCLKCGAWDRERKNCTTHQAKQNVLVAA